METEIYVAIISGAFAVLSAIVAAVNAHKSRQIQDLYNKAQQEHERELKKLQHAHERVLEEGRLDTSARIDLSALVVEAQKNVASAFEQQFKQSQEQYQSLLKEFDAFKRESQEDRRRYVKITRGYQAQVARFRKILSAIKVHLLLMGPQIEEVFNSISDKDPGLVKKVKQLKSMHQTILESLDSVEVNEDVTPSDDSLNFKTV